MARLCRSVSVNRSLRAWPASSELEEARMMAMTSSMFDKAMRRPSTMWARVLAFSMSWRALRTMTCRRWSM